MGKAVLDSTIIKKIVQLRRTGHSLPEIRRITGKGNATVFKYCKNVIVLQKYKAILKAKQGGSIRRKESNWKEAQEFSDAYLPSIENNHKMVILASLYWAEGRKLDFDLINSDPELIRVFINCLEQLGVTKDKLRFSLRLYCDIDKQKAIKFWKNTLKIHTSQIVSINIVKGKKEGKLKYGMCRVRIIKGGMYFKQIMSLIQRIKTLI